MDARKFAAGALSARRWSIDTAGWKGRLYLWMQQAAAAVLLVALAPVLVAIAVCIWRTDGSPIVFGHYRVGRDGRLFRCLKFRTMCRDAERVLELHLAASPTARDEWERDRKLAHDPRVTAIGALLRRTSLDELPQLLNVLRGDMALVGPRPITREELARYGAVRWHYLAVTPGMTGLWQVSGRNDISYDRRVGLDRRYVESRGAWLDLQILLRTVAVVARRQGAR